jgi:ATP-dependent DNA helicase RecQ
LDIHQILLKHWGYSSFRPLQEEIIQSVLNGKDTLALLPTGGGKSITYQVPALVMKGVCLVITPLISLMKDQVDNLKKRGIKAAALHSGMHPHEIDIVLNNCIFGDINLLYISPERLLTPKFKDALQRLTISLLAVDEAHCISQWGYDFRPPYLRIAEIREFLPGIPVLALTATATPEVILDIQKKLNFRKKNIFQSSFERKNLTYFVFKEEDKRKRILKIIKKVKGPGIIYARNRRHTKEIAEYLTNQGISATFYHAGLDTNERDKRQNSWMAGEKRVIVATNAFGMGIDKPNVRFVIHMDFPDSIEAYFQEAGRAGRDELRSFAVLLYEKADILDSRHNIALSYPEIQKIRTVYQSLCNYFQIPVGNGMDASMEFDIGDFSNRYNLQPVIVFNSLKLLEKEGFLMLGEALLSPSKIYIKTDKESLYRFQVANENLDPFIKTILRSYSGVFTEFTQINENDIARRANITPEEVKKTLTLLEKQQILDYIPTGDKPKISFTENRVEAAHLTLSAGNYKILMKDAQRRLESVIHYAESMHKCRSVLLLEYFGESDVKRCGKCDVCLERNKLELTDFDFDNILKEIKPLLLTKPCTLQDLVAAASSLHEDKVIRAVQWLIDNKKIEMTPQNKYFWK